MKSSKWFILITALMLAGLVLVACGGQAQEAVQEVAPTVQAAVEEVAPTVQAAVEEAAQEEAAMGEGSIAVLLPDSASSDRWEADDRRYFEQCFTDAGVDFTIVNAEGDARAQQTQAEQAITNGAKVILLVNLDSGSGAAIIAQAREAGVAIIDYDRLTIEGPGADAYISFDNVSVGRLMGETLEPVIDGLGLDVPQVVQLNGSPTDNNATLFREGYYSIVEPRVAAGDWALIADQAVPDWDNQEALVIFEQILTAADGNVDAVFAANDGLASSVISALKTQGLDPVPVSGQDATVSGMQYVLSGDQTMSVYKPIKLEADAGCEAALALFNGEDVSSLTSDTLNNGTNDIPFIKLTPLAVTRDNMADTVIADGFRTWEEICVGDFLDYCPEGSVDGAGGMAPMTAAVAGGAMMDEGMTETASAELPAYTGGPAEIRMGWWGNDDRAARTLAVIELFQEAYPDITVVGEPNGGTPDHFQIIDTQLAANDAPDIIQFGGNWPDYQQYLEALNGYLGQQLLINTPETFDQAALIPATAADGNLYAVSLGTNTLVLVYNKSMIEAAGVDLPQDNMTWDELIAYGQELKAALPEGVSPFVDNSTNQANYLSYFYRQEGTPLWTSDDGGTSYATVESAQKWLQMWADMRDQGLIPDADTTYTYTEDGPDSSALVAGDAVMGLVWSNQVAAYQDAMTDEVGMTTLPVGGEDSYAIQMSQYLGMNNASENKEAAALFINFFVTSPEAGAILETNRGVPSSPVVRSAIASSATPIDAAVYGIYAAVADRTIPQDPNLPNDQEFVNELELIGQQVAYGQSTVDQAAEDLQALIERLAVK